MSGMLELQLLAAFILDLLLGDPRSIPHPVKGIGFMAVRVEAFLRKDVPGTDKLAGIITVILVVGGTVVISLALLQLSFLIHSSLGIAVSVAMLYFSFATEDLARHARSVLAALEKGDLQLARQNVGMMVGRDISSMTERDTAQATVESIAESTVDGVTAPLFYALLFGPAGAMGYKAVNTLDSMFGYRNKRYMEFGWASAKLDDTANYLPARLTVPIIAAAAWFMRLDGVAVCRSVVRTARLHTSPNAGYPEAAFAGALGVRLGGPRSYDGVRQELPYLGVAETDCTAVTLKRAIRLMMSSAVLFLAVGVSVRLAGYVTWF